MKTFIFLSLFIFYAFAETTFENLYPKYLGVCLASQVKRADLDPEMAWGHIALMIKGACVDREAKYPQLKSCNNTHVLISVNPYIKNVNWIATETFDTIFNGGLSRHAELTQETFSAAYEKLKDIPPFKGVEFHKDVFPNSTNPAFDFAKKVLGYDSAINFGRDTWCAKIPANEAAVIKVIAYLNERNKDYAEKKKDFHYDFFNDNCAHLVHNSLAQIGFEEVIEVRVPFWRRIFNLSIPGNEFLKSIDMTSGRNIKLSEPDKIFKDKKLRTALLELDWLPIQPVIEIEKSAVFKTNKIFGGDLYINVVDWPWNWFSTRKRFDSYLNAYVDYNLSKSISAAKGEYDLALNVVNEKLNEIKDANSEHSVFLTKYKDYLFRQSQSVNSAIQ
ncbi:MAG: hypothetical protein B7Y39_11340 [Bdellovibrio sp. 28-41-41]|nr:MAG: hypothetical protein B7Y39_11340 [Bdellovibrio sp. 28-41-41]